MILIKKYLSLLIVLMLITLPVMAATPTSADMTDPLTYLLNMLKGRNGGQGPQGEPGVTTVIYNNTNVTGPAGPQGPQGIQGIPGPLGPMNQTPNQTAASVRVNDTITGNPGTNAIVFNRGSTFDVILDFIIPQGIQGPTGAQGIQGIQGIPGLDNMTAGPTGAQGIQGIQGIPGLDNMTAGPQGIPGPVAGSNGQVIYNNNSYPNGSPWLTFNNATGTLTAQYFSGDGSALTGIGATSTNLSAIYPVGFVVITTNNVTPATSLGWGNWTSLGTGYALVGV